MLAIRSALYMAWLIVTVVPYALVVLIASVFVRGTPLYRLAAGWPRLAVWAAQWICGIRSEVIGRENLPDGGAILLSKHQSAWETLAFPGIMPRPLSYVFKRELLYVPFFGWALGRLDMVHIDRTKGTEAFTRIEAQGRRMLDIGNWIILFPEGTRVARGRAGQYKTGGTRLAIGTGAPVIPIAVTSAKCWPRQAFIKRPGTIFVSIGPAISPEGKTPPQLIREVEKWIESEMHRLDPEAYKGHEAA